MNPLIKQQKKIRLDQLIHKRGLVATRSQAESYIRLGKVQVRGQVVIKPGFFVDPEAEIELDVAEQYVSRAGLKLASVAQALNVDFQGKIVLDIGSSTGGFTDFALRRGARKVIAVEVGTDQLHPTLRNNPQIELHEKTDIRDVGTGPGSKVVIEPPEIIVGDISFISLREIIPHVVKNMCSADTQLVLMAKPQFEATKSQLTGSGVVKNDRVRRDILREFELWVRGYARIIAKADSEVAGEKGNQERFYLLQPLVDK